MLWDINGVVEEDDDQSTDGSSEAEEESGSGMYQDMLTEQEIAFAQEREGTEGFTAEQQ